MNVCGSICILLYNISNLGIENVIHKIIITYKCWKDSSVSLSSTTEFSSRLPVKSCMGVWSNSNVSSGNGSHLSRNKRKHSFNGYSYNICDAIKQNYSLTSNSLYAQFLELHFADNPIKIDLIKVPEPF